MAETRPLRQFADVWEAIAEAVPDRVALAHDGTELTWRQFDGRANGLAGQLERSGLGPGSTIGVYCPNRPEFVETYHAAQKISAWPFNINYRYGADEIGYLLDNADAVAVVFDTSFNDIAAAVRERSRSVTSWIAVGVDPPDWAIPYELAVASDGPSVIAERSRTGDDIVLVYTGGTTGMPKGVMWPHRELWHSMGRGANAAFGVAALDELDVQSIAGRPPGPNVLLACPLMHATALSNAYSTLSSGGTVTLLPAGPFDPAALWDTVDARQVQSMVIVGDAFARPLLAALDAHPGRWALDSLRVVHSAGVMWSHDVKSGLLEHFRDDALLVDVFGSTEAAAMGSSVSRRGHVAATARFSVGPLAQVISEHGGFVEPGSGEVGLAAFGGPMPSGYYKDPAKTAATFRVVEGTRWSVPGDYATVDADGMMTLLGRGSVCINTGGEKVFVEEVEEVLKLHPQVRDAVCVGVPDERFGETVCAVIEAVVSADDVDPVSIIDHVKARLANYKAPRNVVLVESIGRAPSGKVDYQGLRRLARESLTT